MKRVAVLIAGLLVVVLLGAAACGGDDDEQPTSRPAATTAPAATIAPAPTAEPVSSNNGEVSPEMEDFISGFNGTYEAVEAALADYGATDDIVNHDMGMYNLEEAEIIGSDGNCYSFVSQSGVFKNTYEVCWEGGKIVSITGG